MFDSEQNKEAMHDLRLRWLKTIKLFLEYGADPAQFVIDYSYSGPRGRKRRYPKARVSALLAFNRAFEDFDDLLVESIRNLMISKGATEVDEEIAIFDPIPDPESLRPDSTQGEVVNHKSSLRNLPITGKPFAFRRAERNKDPANRKGTASRARVGIFGPAKYGERTKNRWPSAGLGLSGGCSVGNRRGSSQSRL
jgi:hypothetical protein